LEKQEPKGALVLNREWRTVAFALFNLQARGFIYKPQDKVYVGMVIGRVLLRSWRPLMVNPNPNTLTKYENPPSAR